MVRARHKETVVKMRRLRRQCPNCGLWIIKYAPNFTDDEGRPLPHGPFECSNPKGVAAGQRFAVKEAHQVGCGEMIA